MAKKKTTKKATGKSTRKAAPKKAAKKPEKDRVNVVFMSDLLDSDKSVILTSCGHNNHFDFFHKKKSTITTYW